MLKNLFPAVALIFFATAVNAQNKSVYTDLAGTRCKTLELTDDEGGSYSGECRGTAGYKLNLIEGDLRQTIDVIDPQGKKHELAFWSVVSFGFSSVGPKAEWRVKRKAPVALIVRLNVSENPEDSSIRTSYLVVTKITRDEICVTDTIKPSRTQNAEARRAADNAATKECKETELRLTRDPVNPKS
jgi:hypothetical protein